MRRRSLRIVLLVIGIAVLVAVALAVAVLLARPAPSSDRPARSPAVLALNARVADAGAEVTVRAAHAPSALRLYLVPTRLAREVRSRYDRRVHFVGRLVPNRRGRGALTFEVPPLESDRYSLAAWCPGCQPRFFLARRPLLRVRLPRATADACPVTIPNGKGPDDLHGNGFLSIGLLRPAVLRHRPEPDGSIADKLGWVPTGIDGAQSVLTVAGRRIDAPSPPMQVLGVNWGYSSTGRGGWASAVRFPSAGCWRLIGRVEDIRLSFVVKVEPL